MNLWFGMADFSKTFLSVNQFEVFSDVIAVSGLAQFGCNFATQVNCGQTEVLHGRSVLS